MVTGPPSRDSRAWALVQLAHILRRKGRYEEALGALDLAVGLRSAPAAELHAYACAVAVHLASGDGAAARNVADSARSRAGDARLMRALGGSYLKLFHDSGEPFLLDESFGCFQLAALEDALS